MRERTHRSGAWAAVLALGLVYACGGDDRDFGADTGTGTGGAAGASNKGGASSGGAAGKPNTGGGGAKSSTGGSFSDAGAGAGGQPPEGGAPSSTGGTSTGGTVATGGQGGEAGSGGEGGDAIVTPPDPGRPGAALVAGGFFMKSSHFRLVSSTGEGPGGNTLHSSPKYRLIGGLVGTSQP